MSLFEILMIEDFCDRVEGKKNNSKEKDKGIGLFGFILMLIGFAFARDYFAERLVSYKLHLAAAIIVLTILIPIAIKTGHTIIAKILFVSNVVIGFMLCSILMTNIMGGTPTYTIVQENLAFAETISITPIKVIGKLILWILKPISVVADIVIIPLALIPFIQRLIWKYAVFNNF